MKKLTLFFTALVFTMFANSWNASAQQDAFGQDESFMKERRIFLWDVTISMVGATKDASCPKASPRKNPGYNYNEGYPNYNVKKDIFDETREKLINLILQIQNESTEIIVLPFRNGIVGSFKASATAEGKQQIIDEIRAWNDLRSGGTYTATCLKDAVDIYFTPDRVNRLFLLTDGEPSGQEGSQLIRYIENWQGIKVPRCPQSYMVYIMLTDEAYNEDIIHAAEKTNGDIIVVSEFKEPVFLSIGHKASIHVREHFNGKVSKDGRGEFTVPYTMVAGNRIPDNSNFHFAVEGNDFLYIDPKVPVSPENGKFVVPFVLKKDLDYYLANLPSNHNLCLNVRCTKDSGSNKEINITGSNVVKVSLVIKKEPRATISWEKNN